MVAEDSLLIREGLVRVLDGLGHTVVATATRADQVPGQMARHRPDLAVLDIRMPPTLTDEGIRCALSIRERHPRTAILVLSQYPEPAHAATLLEHDPRAVGYLLKERILDSGVLAGAIDRVHAGETVIDPTLVAGLVHRQRRAGPLDVLTGRERDTLALMAEGLSDRGIAERWAFRPPQSGPMFRACSASWPCPEPARTTAASSLCWLTCASDPW